MWGIGIEDSSRLGLCCVVAIAICSLVSCEHEIKLAVSDNPGIDLDITFYEYSADTPPQECPGGHILRPWGCVPDACTAVEPIPPEPHRPRRQPLEGGTTPRLLWPEAERCDSIDYSSAIPKAYVEMEIDGEVRELVVLLLTGRSGQTLSSNTFGVAFNDANTGALVSCYAFPNDSMTVMEPFFVVSQLGRFYYATGTESGESGMAPEVSIWSDGPGGDFFSTFYLSDFRNLSHFSLSRWGEAVMTLDDELIGFDPMSGAALWVTQAGDRLNNPNLIGLEPCGVVTEEPPEKAYVLFEIGTATVLRLKSGELVVVTQDGETVREPNCFDPVQVRSDVLACAEFTDSTHSSIIAFDLEGTWRRVTPLQGRYEEISGTTGLVAGVDDTLLLGVSLSNGSETARFATVAVDVVKGEVKWSLEVGLRYPFGFLTPRGVLIQSSGALQTDVLGLAPTQYPRGVYGGNENRGAVALPEP